MKLIILHRKSNTHTLALLNVMLVRIDYSMGRLRISSVFTLLITHYLFPLKLLTTNKKGFPEKCFYILVAFYALSIIYEEFPNIGFPLTTGIDYW